MAWFAWGVWGERGRELGKVAAARRTATGVLISPLLPLVVADHQPDLLRHASGLREGLGPGQKSCPPSFALDLVHLAPALLECDIQSRKLCCDLAFFALLSLLPHLFRFASLPLNYPSFTVRTFISRPPPAPVQQQQWRIPPAPSLAGRALWRRHINRAPAALSVRARRRSIDARCLGITLRPRKGSAHLHIECSGCLLPSTYRL